MTGGIVDTCPECGSTVVWDTIGSNRATHQRPRYYCDNCGIRFDNPKQYDEVTEEFV